MARSMLESEKLYEQIKNYFLNDKRAQFVIEICDKEFSEWEVFHVYSVEEMIAERSRLIEKGSDLAGFINFEGHYNFYYVDGNFVKSQNMDNGEIVEFQDYTIKNHYIAKVIEELQQLQGS